MRKFLMILLLCMGFNTYADEPYFLCGSDEDGCSSDNYSACFCMPYDGALATQSYCLNLKEVSCKPLSSLPKCDSGLVFKDQGTCLAVAFQSEPQPPCQLTTQTFCQAHQALICDKDGGMNSCH